MIELKKVNKVYENGFHVLKNIDLQFNEGEINVLIGPSGCGKTTTMKLLNRLTDHTDGDIFINGKNILDFNTIELRRQIGYVIQSIGLFPHMTIYENVATVPKLLKWDKEKIDRRVDELLSLVHLAPDQYKKRFPSELSGGQQQRIGVIRALAAEPSIILMDEPFSALDPISRENLQDELVSLQKEIKKTIVFVTHDMDEAIKIADQIILMKDGEIVQKGTPNELLTNPANNFVREFIGENRLRNFQSSVSIKDFIDTSALCARISSPKEKIIESMLASKCFECPIIDSEENYLGFIPFNRLMSEKEASLENLLEVSVPPMKAGQTVQEMFSYLETYEIQIIPVVNNEKKWIGSIDVKRMIESFRFLYEERGVL